MFCQCVFVVISIMFESIISINQIISLYSQHISLFLRNGIILQIDILEIVLHGLSLLESPRVALSDITNRLELFFRSIVIVIHVQFIYSHG